MTSAFYSEKINSTNHSQTPLPSLIKSTPKSLNLTNSTNSPLPLSFNDEVESSIFKTQNINLNEENFSKAKRFEVTKYSDSDKLNCPTACHPLCSRSCVNRINITNNTLINKYIEPKQAETQYYDKKPHHLSLKEYQKRLKDSGIALNLNTKLNDNENQEKFDYLHSTKSTDNSWLTTKNVTENKTFHKMNKNFIKNMINNFNKNNTQLYPKKLENSTSQNTWNKTKQSYYIKKEEILLNNFIQPLTSQPSLVQQSNFTNEIKNQNNQFSNNSSNETRPSLLKNKNIFPVTFKPKVDTNGNHFLVNPTFLNSTVASNTNKFNYLKKNKNWWQVYFK